MTAVFRFEQNIAKCLGAKEPASLFAFGIQISSMFVGRFQFIDLQIVDVWVAFTGRHWVFTAFAECDGVFDDPVSSYHLADSLFGTSEMATTECFFKRLFEMMRDLPLDESAFVKAFTYSADAGVPGTEFHKWIGRDQDTAHIARPFEKEVFDKKSNPLVFERYFLGKHLFFNNPVDIYIEGLKNNTLKLYFQFGYFDIIACIRVDKLNLKYEIVDAHQQYPDEKSGPGNTRGLSIQGMLTAPASDTEHEIDFASSVSTMAEIAIAMAFEQLFLKTFWAWYYGETEPIPKRKETNEVKNTNDMYARTECSTKSRDPDSPSPNTVITFGLSSDSFTNFRTPRSEFAYHEGNFADEVEFLGRVIWFDQEVDLWLYYLTQPNRVPEFGFMLTVPGEKTPTVRIDFSIPESAFDLAVELNSFSPEVCTAIIQVISFIKTCNLADKFLSNHGYKEGVPYVFNS